MGKAFGNLKSGDCPLSPLSTNPTFLHKIIDPHCSPQISKVGVAQGIMLSNY